MNKSDRRILIASGGSGGHIFPAIALASAIYNKHRAKVFFVSSRRRLDKDILLSAGFPVLFMSINPMPFGRNPIKWSVFLMKFLADIFHSAFALFRIKPDVVVGFGGYVSGAISKCAIMIGIPLVIHEQNFVPGRANKILAENAARVAVSFLGTEQYLPEKSKKKIVLTGNPIRVNGLIKDRVEGAKHLGLAPELKIILIIGGSQGASFLNDNAAKALDIFRATNELFQVVHITGKKDYPETEKYYIDRAIRAKVFSFLDRIDAAYAACDMAISRSGASAVFELAYYGKPMILVPYPNPKNNQRSNAEYFQGRGAAVLMEEKDITPEKMCGAIKEILTDDVLYKKMSKASLSLAAGDAAEKLADVVAGMG